MEALRDSIRPEALELFKKHDRRNSPMEERVEPHPDGNRLQRRAAKAIERRQRKLQPA